MVEHPRITREPDGALVVWDVTHVRPNRDWRFLGWLLLGATIAVVLSDIRGWRFATGISDYMIPLVSALVAVILIGLGGKPQLVERPLLRVTPLPAMTMATTDALDSVLAGEHAEGTDPELRVEAYAAHGIQSIEREELTHLVFGMIDAPWPGRRGVHVEAFALYLAKHDGTPVPIIDGTMDKMASWNIARHLSSVLEIPVIEMGKGA